MKSEKKQESNLRKDIRSIEIIIREIEAIKQRGGFGIFGLTALADITQWKRKLESSKRALTQLF